MSLLGRLTGHSFPFGTGRDSPVAVTVPDPVDAIDLLLLSSNEGLHRTHAVLLLRTSTNPGERSNAVINNDTDLFAGSVLARQD